MSLARPAAAGLVARIANPGLAIAAAGGLSALITRRLWQSIPYQLHIHTDIVGYPIFNSFNIERSTDIYLLMVVLLPVLWIAFYLLLLAVLDLLARRLWSMPPRTPAPESTGLEPSRRPLASAAGKLLAVAFTLGLEVAIIIGNRPTVFWRVANLGTAVAVTVVVLSGLAWRRLRPGPGRLQRIGAANSLAAVLVVAGLVGVAEVTVLTVASDGSTRQYDWLPPWLGAVLTAMVLLFVLGSLRRARTAAAVAALESRLIRYLAVPVALFLVLAFVTASPSAMEVFHEGERLAAGRLLEAGYFPWRDILSVHGVLDDSLSAIIGFWVFEPSRFGAGAASTMFLNPLYLVFLFILFGRWFGRNWALLAASAAILINAKLALPQSRFIIWPLVLLLLTATIAGPPLLGVGLGCLLAVQAILVPESAYCLPACGLVLIGADLQRRGPGVLFRRAFATTLGTILGGGVTLLLFTGLLIWQQALSSFIFYYVVAAPGHAYTGGIPVQIYSGNLYPFRVLAPLAAIAAAWAYFATRLLRRRRLEAVEWAAMAAGIFALLYYTKYLDRADDGHVFQSYSVAMPLIVFVVFRLVALGEAAIARFPLTSWFARAVSPRPFSVALLAGLLLFPGLQPWEQVAQVPAHFRPVAATPPELPQLGPGGYFDPSTYEDLATITSAYLGPNDWIFDFSNEPGLYYFLLKYRPHTRYYQVSFAIPEAAQADLLDQLKADRPRLIVFTNDGLGLPSWDGIPNMVRHYDVSQWILDNYVPLLSSHSQVIYADARAHLDLSPLRGTPLSAPVVTDGLYFAGAPCSWGDAPNYLRVSPPRRPSAASGPVDVSFRTWAEGSLSIVGRASEVGSDRPPAEIVVMRGEEVIARAQPSLPRLDGGAATGSPNLAGDGFRIQVPVDRATDANGHLLPLLIVGITVDGRAGVIGSTVGGLSGKALPVTVSAADGRAVPLLGDLLHGSIDTVTQAPLLLQPPARTSWSDYRWLEIESAGGFASDSWTLSDETTGDTLHTVLFNTLPSPVTTFRVYIGACSQWHGYGASPLYLYHLFEQHLVRLRLVP